ncbi:MAG: LuxR C-terminal-related transcriptional regulator [Bacteroidales bacterium]|nr:LuxR C-terminal-related transcriptional regulator [Bacteroidales bacterium]
MSNDSKKNVLIVTPSLLLARGLEAFFSSTGEFRVYGIISDLEGGAELRLKSGESDVIIIDPTVFGFSSRLGIRQYVPDSGQAAVVALRTEPMSDEELKQYDDSIILYDSPVTVVKKLRAAVESMQEKPKYEGDELSAREKEILVCVAKGMLNKEIADYFNLSIHTVITHRKNITRKTGIRSVAGLTVYALLNKLIEPDAVE